ncbi:outer membrane protein assembly factor BamD [bacterium]|nr:outer membrane protein assembly factor BamD [bacterium]
MGNARGRITRFLLLIFIPLLLCPSIHGEQLLLKDEDVYRFASELFQNGEYYRAVSEYKRLEFYFPNSPLTNNAFLQIGKSYMAGNRTSEAINFWLFKLRYLDSSSENYFQVKTLLGISLLDLGNEKTFSLRRKNIENAFSHFAEVEGDQYENRVIQDFTEEWMSRSPPPTKSPAMAGVMSAVVPGSGSVYCGRYMEGIYGFFITGLFYLATMDALKNENEGLGLVLGFFTVSFYGGNIYTGVNSAYKLNDKMEADELLRLRKKHGIWYIPEAKNKKGRF